MEKNLIERAKTFSFVLHWHLWRTRYQDEYATRNKMGYGYRAGVFYPNGARYGEHHDDWPPFFDRMAVHGLSALSIDSLFCYQKYRSCQVFIDSTGSNFIFP